MAGFTLGGGGGGGRQNLPPEDLIPTADSPFLYNRSGASNSSRQPAAEEVTVVTYTGNKGFELWQQQQQQQPPHHHQYLYHSGLSMMLDDPTAGPGGSGSSVGTGGRGMRRGGTGTGAGAMSCQDCGNQAKKDCMHMRCRTCCKSRGFHCATHVRSTWVSAAKRRERQQQVASMKQQQPPLLVRGSTGSGRGVAAVGGGQQSKRPIIEHGSSTLACVRLPAAATMATTSAASGGLAAAPASFPTEVSSPAVFRCIRVSSVNGPEDQYAYQTAVNIGGHVFKGILYDQGADSLCSPRPGDASSSSVAVNAAAGGGAVRPSSTAATAAAAVDQTSSRIDQASLYQTPLSAFMTGAQFFHQYPRS